MQLTRTKKNTFVYLPIKTKSFVNFMNEKGHAQRLYNRLPYSTNII